MRCGTRDAASKATAIVSIDSRSAASSLTDALLDVGITHVFANLGTDHVSIIDDFARREADGVKAPAIITAAHENVAAHMAAGHALATGRGQAVLVHVDAGTANSVMAMHNLFRTRIPVLLLAGKAPFSVSGMLPGARDHYVNFIQDPGDLASLVRPYMKWIYDLPAPEMVRPAVLRAAQIMNSEPKGPVFLTFARETLAAPEQKADGSSRNAMIASPALDPVVAERFADAILAAERPVLITSYLGRDHAAVPLLAEFAEVCGIDVLEYNPTHMNMPRTSKWFAGFDTAAAIAQSDLGLLFDVDVPFIPKTVRSGPKCWLQVDVDPLKSAIPVWGFDTDISAQADCRCAMEQILAIIRAKWDEDFRTRVRERAARAALRFETTGVQQDHKRQIALSAENICAAVARRLGDHDVVVNEAVTNAAKVLEYMPRSEPGTYFSDGGGGLGFSGGVALGLKLALPDRRVVQIVGDGVFHFCNPDAVYAAAQAHRLPILTVILDNGGWNAVKGAVKRVYPQGAAVDADQFYARLSQADTGQRRDFHKIGEAFGAHGEAVTTPDELDAALGRCFEALDEGRAAILTCRLATI